MRYHRGYSMAKTADLYLLSFSSYSKNSHTHGLIERTIPVVIQGGITELQSWSLMKLCSLLKCYAVSRSLVKSLEVPEILWSLVKSFEVSWIPFKSLEVVRKFEVSVVEVFWSLLFLLVVNIGGWHKPWFRQCKVLTMILLQMLIESQKIELKLHKSRLL